MRRPQVQPPPSRPAHQTDERILEKLKNHAATVALYFMYCTFARVHQTLRVTPAMEVGLADLVWPIEEIVARPPR